MHLKLKSETEGRTFPYKNMSSASEQKNEIEKYLLSPEEEMNYVRSGYYTDIETSLSILYASYSGPDNPFKRFAAAAGQKCSVPARSTAAMQAPAAPHVRPNGPKPKQ